MINLLNFILIALLLSGCSSSFPGLVATKTPSPQEILDSNLQQWKGSRINHYRYSLSVNCVCEESKPYFSDSPLSVEVANGQVISVVNKDGNVIQLQEDPDYSTITDLFTIEGLFEYAKNAQHGAEEFQIAYDLDKGFPDYIGIYWIAGDDNNSMKIDISDFEVLP